MFKSPDKDWVLPVVSAADIVIVGAFQGSSHNQARSFTPIIPVVKEKASGSEPRVSSQNT